jgi:acyl dehydratase
MTFAADPVEFEVERQQIIDFAQATNDEHPLHRSGELAPPVFPVVGALMDAISPAVMAVAPAALAARVVHGEHDFRYHQPIVPGTTLVTRAAAIGVRAVSTGVVVTGKGVTSELVVTLPHVARLRTALNLECRRRRRVRAEIERIDLEQVALRASDGQLGHRETLRG